MSTRFAGKKVVITGAAGVYGRALATAFHAEGASLLLSDHDPAVLDEATASLGSDRITRLAADLTSDAAIDALIAKAKEGSPPAVLINNAGLYPFIQLMNVTPADYDRILGVNMRAPFRLMQGIGGAMDRGGAIVNVTSAAAEVVRSNGVPYGASKCGLEYLTRAFAVDLGARGVRVNSVRPGYAEGSRHVSVPPGYGEIVKARSILGRNSEPKDFATIVLWVCSAEAQFVTGAVLDGGGGGTINRREGAATRAGR